VGHVVAPGGQVSAIAGRMEIAGAREVLVLIKLFASEAAASAIPRIEAELAPLATGASVYDALLEAHARLHQALFNRLEIDLGADPASRQDSIFFYEDFLVEGPGGKVIFSPSLSPDLHNIRDFVN